MWPFYWPPVRDVGVNGQQWAKDTFDEESFSNSGIFFLQIFFCRLSKDGRDLIFVKSIMNFFLRTFGGHVCQMKIYYNFYVVFKIKDTVKLLNLTGC
jgi:hypothetical protein